jgi:hypothetical protein
MFPSKFPIIPWASLLIFSLPILWRMPLPHSSSEDIAWSDAREQGVASPRALMRYDESVLELFAHHLRIIPAPPVRQVRPTAAARRTAILPSDPEIVVAPAITYRGDRFMKLGQSQINNVITFFIKDNSSGAIKEFILDRPKDGFVLVQKEGVYYLENKEGEVYSL